jgi:3-hydroxybutyrate dehydrogenase
MSLRGKCALITGSTGGLGRIVAEHFASKGCNVVLNGVVPESDMTRSVAELEKANGITARYDRADLRKPDEIAAMMQRAFAAFGAVDILVNNAVVRHFSPVETFPVERWDEALAVNISAVFHAIRLALPSMREQGWGRIINVASPYSFIAVANRIDYVTTKTALLGLTRTVALETAGEDITCNAVAPALCLHRPSRGKSAALPNIKASQSTWQHETIWLNANPGDALCPCSRLPPSWDFFADRIPATSAAPPSRWIADGP